MMAGGLRAVFAVFAAPPAAPVDDGAEVNMLAAEMLLQPSGFGGKFLQGRVKEQGKVISSLQAKTCHDFVG
jgi:hypothetical protein